MGRRSPQRSFCRPTTGPGHGCTARSPGWWSIVPVVLFPGGFEVLTASDPWPSTFPATICTIVMGQPRFSSAGFGNLNSEAWSQSISEQLSSGLSRHRVRYCARCSMTWHVPATT